jgi:hypothetical protein
MPQQTKRSPTSRSNSTRSRNGRSASRSSSTRSRNGRSGATSASSKRTSRSRSAPRKKPVANVANSTKQGAKKAGSNLGDFAEKAKVPALAVSAGLVGLAGGMALTARNSRKRILGMPMATKSGTQAVSKNLADAAKNVGRFGEGMGSLAAEVRRAREGLAAEGNTEKRPSPIEVVLQGLTRRR